MNAIRRLITSTLLFQTVLLAYSASSQEINLDTSNGISIQQVQYVGNPDQLSNTGLLDIDLIRLRESTGKQSGFINMSIESEWLVRNVPIEEESTYPYSHISTEFDLNVEFEVEVLNLSGVALSYSDDLLEDYSPELSASFSLDISTINYDLGGIPETPITGAPLPPDATEALFGDSANTEAITQLDHPNIEAANNQCMPASIANSLQFLEDTTNLKVPHDNVMGLKGDNSLVGQLDTHTNRTVVDRRSAGNTGTWGIDGKLSYLATNGLHNQVQTTHMGVGENSGDFDITITVGENAAKASGLGTTVSFQTLFNAMKEGQDCELVYSWPDGAHAVDAVAAGTTRGQPWILHSSDMDQSSDSAGAGPEGMRFEYLKDTDGDGLLNLNGSNRQLVQVICEKYVPPPPVTTEITGIDDPAGHSCCTTPPPSVIDVILQGSILSIDGAAPWLPMSGSVSPGSDFSISSVSTVAGFPNITSTFSGNFNSATSEYENFQFTLGANGGLPQGLPITYDMNVMFNDSSPQLDPVIRSNGFRDLLIIDAADPISLTVELESANQEGTAADWWIVSESNAGIQSFNLSTGQFEDGLAPTFQGSLIDVPFTRLKLLNEGLDTGDYTFYFGVDLSQNGQLDPSSLVFDSVEVNVR